MDAKLAVFHELQAELHAAEAALTEATSTEECAAAMFRKWRISEQIVSTILYKPAS
jgi:hypothetical protein